MSPARRPVRHPDLGAVLRRAREASGLSGNRLALRRGWNQAKVSLIETGRQTPSEADVLAWAEETGAEGAALLEARERALVRRLDIREAARQPGGVEALQGDLAALEAGSTLVAEYQPSVVPGLAQTPAYTRTWLSQPGRVELGAGIDVDEIVHRRAMRQRAARERSVVIALGPTALTAVYGSPAVQREQLDALARAVRRGDMELVVPRRPPALLHGFELLDDAAIVETVVGLHVMADPDVVSQFRQALDLMRQHGAVGEQALHEVERARDMLTDE